MLRAAGGRRLVAGGGRGWVAGGGRRCVAGNGNVRSLYVPPMVRDFNPPMLRDFNPRKISFIPGKEKKKEKNKEKEEEKEEEESREHITWFKTLKEVVIASMHILMKLWCEKNITFQKNFLSFMSYTESVKFQLIEAAKYAIPTTLTLDSACQSFAQVYSSPLISITIFAIGSFITMHFTTKRDQKNMVEIIEIVKGMNNDRLTIIAGIEKDMEELKESTKVAIKEAFKIQEEAMKVIITQHDEEIKRIWGELATKSTKWW